MKTLEQAIAKLEQWLIDELELLNQSAHDVAGQIEVEDMLKAKQQYDLQDVKVSTIEEVIQMLKK